MRRPTYSGKVLLYPSAGSDFADAVDKFGDWIDTFVFVDLSYRLLDFKAPVLSGWFLNRDRVSFFKVPPSMDRAQQLESSSHRQIDPEWLFLPYSRIGTNRKITIVLRKGFGQYALHEIEDGGLSVFMHRGDSPGEGGSNVFYLDNRKRRHPPLSNLLDVIKRKLTSPGFVVSDGSNTSIAALYTMGGDESQSFQSHGLIWCFESLMPGGGNGRKTRIWRIESCQSYQGQDLILPRDRRGTNLTLLDR